MISRGQVYRSAKPVDRFPDDWEFVQIQVISDPHRHYTGANAITIATIQPGTGKLIRQRSILMDQLHATATTKTGKPRKTGWILKES